MNTCRASSSFNPASIGFPCKSPDRADDMAAVPVALPPAVRLERAHFVAHLQRHDVLVQERRVAHATLRHHRQSGLEYDSRILVRRQKEMHRVPRTEAHICPNGPGSTSGWPAAPSQSNSKSSSDQDQCALEAAQALVYRPVRSKDAYPSSDSSTCAAARLK